MKRCIPCFSLLSRRPGTVLLVCALAVATQCYSQSPGGDTPVHAGHSQGSIIFSGIEELPLVAPPPLDDSVLACQAGSLANRGTGMNRGLIVLIGLGMLLSTVSGVFGEGKQPKAIVLTDMSKCLPASALSPVSTHTQWQVAEYDAGEIEGKMILAHAFAKAPEVRLPVNRKGWHAIRIGFWPGINTEGCTLRYRLSSEQTFTLIHQAYAHQWTRTDLIETLPRYVDLTGVESIVFGKHDGVTSCIAYVRLDPLSEAQANAIQQDRRRTDTRRMIQLIDGHGVFSALPWNIQTTDALREFVEGYRHSDFRMIMWGANGGDLTFYPTTKVGRFILNNDAPSPTPGDKRALDNHNALAKAGVPNPFEVVLKHCHDIGLEFHLYYRMALADCRDPVAWTSAETFWLKEHPECRMLAKDGTPMGLASYAFPQVRDFMVSLIEEGMQYDIDGVNICLIRGPEYVGYEQPVIDDFKKLHGEDPRDLPDHEERLQELRTGYMTEFFRAVRKAADKRGDERGRKIQVSTYVESSDEHMQYFGYDCYTWIEEKLVDFVFVLGYGTPRLLALADKMGCKRYLQAAKSAGAAVGNAKNAYAHGHEGVWFWDGDMLPFQPETWNIVSRLGHKAEVTALSPDEKSYPKMKRTQLRSIGDQDLAKTVSKDVPGGWPPEMVTLFPGG